MINKLLIIPNSIDDIMSLRNAGISAFLLPLEDYSIGYNSFSIDFINSLEEEVFLLVNRIMTSREIDKIVIDINKIKKIKGIFYEDLGVFYSLKGKYELINYQTHFNTHYNAINYLIELGNKSAVVASDITYNEIKMIKDNVKAPICLFVFGKLNIMYSRRTLIKNYNANYKLSKEIKTIGEKISTVKFDLEEDENGTYLFDHHFYNGCDLLNLGIDNVYYYIINSKDLLIDEVLTVIKNILNKEYSNNNLNELVNTGFLYKETIYRVKGGE